MPRYFFHVRNQTDYTHDEVGVELIDLGYARQHAADAAGQILTSDLGQGRNDVIFQVQVEQEPGVRVLDMTVRGTVEAPVTSPSGSDGDSAD